MMFSKNYCGYCKDAQIILIDKGIKFKVVEMDKIRDGDLMDQKIKAKAK